jgi:hypothetical protein
MMELVDVIGRFNENSIPYTAIAIGTGYSIVVCEYGGRILGPFNKHGESFGWINPVFKDKNIFKDFIKNRQWNVGGERIWLAPEGQYNVPDENNFWKSYRVPDSLDPGNYTLSKDEYDTTVLSQVCTLDVYNNRVKTKILTMIRNIYKAANHFDYPEVDFFGYHHEISLEEKKNDGVVTESWNLLQVLPLGTIVIPTTVKAQYVEYYESFEPGYQNVYEKHVSLRIDALKRYKVGYKASCLTGRSGYLRAIDGKFILMVRSHYVDPTGAYFKAPVGRPDECATALYVYNDDGEIGNFAEHETCGRPIGGSTGKKRNMDLVTTCYFLGPEKSIDAIGEQLLGVKMDALHS